MSCNTCHRPNFDTMIGAVVFIVLKCIMTFWGFWLLWGNAPHWIFWVVLILYPPSRQCFSFDRGAK